MRSAEAAIRHDFEVGLQVRIRSADTAADLRKDKIYPLKEVATRPRPHAERLLAAIQRLTKRSWAFGQNLIDHPEF